MIFAEYEKPAVDARYFDDEEWWWHQMAEKYIPPGRYFDFCQERKAHVSHPSEHNSAIIMVKETY